MFPPSQGSPIDLAALSGICGSISIACWVVVFSPQIIENFRRSSAEGLSIVFIVVWLVGDVFNILGAILQGVLPTMIILAIYYTLADIVLLLQCFYYRGFTLSDEVKPKPSERTHDDTDPERRPLLNGNDNDASSPRETRHSTSERRESSLARLRQRLADGTRLSPATPLHDAPKLTDPPSIQHIKPYTMLQTAAFNTVAILLVCTAGIFGWWLSTRTGHNRRHRKHEVEQQAAALEFDMLGQVFGYLCAIFYLGSRVPQLLLNYRRKSTEGVSLLFFLFACIGNLTYDMSIFAYDPTPLCEERGIGHCGPGEASSIYARYIAVNASWIAGSLGTLFLDMAIFVQFFLYRKDDVNETAVVVDDR